MRRALQASVLAILPAAILTAGITVWWADGQGYLRPKRRAVREYFARYGMPLQRPNFRRWGPLYSDTFVPLHDAEREVVARRYGVRTGDHIFRQHVELKLYGDDGREGDKVLITCLFKGDRMIRPLGQ